MAAVIIIPTTIYKFNEELSDLSAQTEFQKNTIITKTALTEMMQANIDSNNTEIKSAKTPEPATNNNEIIQQRRHAYEKEIQSRRQKYQEMMAARQQEMAKAAEEQKEKFQRIRQNQLETRLKVQEMQEQIFELHEKIHQLMQERYTRHRP
ncbi:MAG: hypothetical protein GQ550_07705 [Gammaproteobacteria bacterium]|nr:hypothetical protein [Gammaproteobacteria bacterium]